MHGCMSVGQLTGRMRQAADGVLCVTAKNSDDSCVGSAVGLNVVAEVVCVVVGVDVPGEAAVWPLQTSPPPRRSSEIPNNSVAMLVRLLCRLRCSHTNAARLVFSQ